MHQLPIDNTHPIRRQRRSRRTDFDGASTCSTQEVSEWVQHRHHASGDSHDTKRQSGVVFRMTRRPIPTGVFGSVEVGFRGLKAMTAHRTYNYVHSSRIDSDDDIDFVYRLRVKRRFSTLGLRAPTGSISIPDGCDALTGKCGAVGFVHHAHWHPNDTAGNNQGYAREVWCCLCRTARARVLRRMRALTSTFLAFGALRFMGVPTPTVERYSRQLHHERRDLRLSRKIRYTAGVHGRTLRWWATATSSACPH